MHIIKCVVNSPTNVHQGLENSELHSFRTRYGPVAGSCDHRNKPFNFHKIYKNLFTCWAIMASQRFYSVKTIQQIHLYHKRSVTLPRRWCGGNPGRTDHRRKQTLSRGCEVDVLVDACILPSSHSQLAQYSLGTLIRCSTTYKTIILYI